MARLIISYILPLVLPMALYFCWMWVIRHRSRSRGDEIPEIKNSSIFWSAIAGIILMFIGLGILAASGGVPPGEGFYQSPRLENGKIIPPKFD
jgi:heme/copper-type cytochrome/quinol oxidase subunit 2